MNRPAAHVYVVYSPHFQDGVGNEAETKISASSLFTSGLACPNHQDTNDRYAMDFLGTGLVVEDHVQERAVHMQL